MIIIYESKIHNLQYQNHLHGTINLLTHCNHFGGKLGLNLAFDRFLDESSLEHFSILPDFPKMLIYAYLVGYCQLAKDRHHVHNTTYQLKIWHVISNKRCIFFI